MTQEEQLPPQIGIQSNSGGDISIKQSQVTIAGGNITHIHPPPVSKAKQREQAKREKLLKWIRQRWLIQYPYLGKDRQKIALKLEEQLDAILNPWFQDVQEFEYVPGPLPPETSIIQIYDRVHGNLLILGEPGSGKTILLLDLLHELLMRARDDEEPLPMVFQLSS